jgi:putative SOS response-associated peptidase YedK
MCYNITILNPEYFKHYESILSFDQTEKIEPVYYRNAFSLPNHPVIPNIKPYRISEFNWGLIPFWIKTSVDAENIRVKTMNARAETIFEKPSYRFAIMKRRCLIPADGFYEWRYYNGRNYPYYIHMKNHDVFSLAGIWELWTNAETKENISTFSIITCKANELLKKIHNKKKRMPVILPKEKEQIYLQQDLSKNGIKELLIPIDQSLLEAYTISNRITSNTKNRNDPKIIEPFQYPELSGI